MVEIKVRSNKTNLDVYINNVFDLELLPSNVLDLMAIRLEQEILELKLKKHKK